jgi:hypothetical protein
MRQRSVLCLVGLLVGLPTFVHGGPGSRAPRGAGAKVKPVAKGAPAGPSVKEGASSQDAERTSELYQAPRPMFRWDLPKVLSEVDVPEEFETNGIPNRFRALVVALPPEQAYAHFYESFVRQGLYVAPLAEQLDMEPGQASLTGYDPEREISYTVFLTAYDNGTTGVIMGEAFFKGRAMVAGNPFVPVMAGAEDVVTQNLESGRSLSFRVQSNEAEVRAFYARVFGEKGYTQDKDGTWTRGRSVLHVLTEPSLRHPQSLDVGVVEFTGPSH